MEELKLSSDSSDLKIGDETCNKCVVFRRVVNEVELDNLEIFSDCPGPQPNPNYGGGCSEREWICGHPYTKTETEGLSPVERIKDEAVALAALREQLNK